MKYNTIEIRFSTIDKRWAASYSIDATDRIKSPHQPHALGFYHHPARMLPRNAFIALKKCMIERHKTEIERLQKSLASLEKFEPKFKK